MKKKEIMTIVRKQAMGHWLENEKDKKDAKDTRPRLGSETSEVSRSSIASMDGTESSARPAATRRRSSQKKQTIPTDRTASQSNSSEQRHGSASQLQLVKTSSVPGEMMLEPGSLFLAMDPVENRLFDQRQVPLLKSIGKSLDPFRTMFQSGNPRVSVEELKYSCSQYFGTVGLGRLWIPTCVERPHTFLSTLFLAATYHDVINWHSVESLETTALRQDVIVMVSEDFTDAQKRIDDHNIIAVSQLIIGEVMARNEKSRDFHEKGMEKMIAQRGIENMGLNGRIASAVSWVHLTSAILRQVAPRPMYHDYIRQYVTKQYSPAAMVPESPLYRPREKFFTLERSFQCNEKTLALIKDMRAMIEHFLQETPGSMRHSATMVTLYRNILKYESVTRLASTNVLRDYDWKYEAIRIAAIVQATAIVSRIPLSAALHEAGALPSKRSTSFYTSSNASRSSESLFSAMDPQQISPLTECSTSPTFQIHDPVIGRPGIPFDNPTVDFDLQRVSISSQSSIPHRTSSSSEYPPSLAPAHRPSLSSVQSSTSDMTHFPLATVGGSRMSTPNNQGSLLVDFKEALEKSNLSYAWKDMAGMLFWIGLVMGAASHEHENKILARYCSSTALRAGIMLCFEHPEAVHATVVTMTDVVAALNGGESPTGQVTNTETQNGAKRRRPTTSPRVPAVSRR